jgi:hypothetical protein
MINQKSLKEIRKTRKTTGARKMRKVEKQLLQLSKRPNLKKLIQNKLLSTWKATVRLDMVNNFKVIFQQ